MFINVLFAHFYDKFMLEITIGLVHFLKYIFIISFTTSQAIQEPSVAQFHFLLFSLCGHQNSIFIEMRICIMHTYNYYCLNHCFIFPHSVSSFLLVVPCLYSQVIFCQHGEFSLLFIILLICWQPTLSFVYLRMDSLNF